MRPVVKRAITLSVVLGIPIIAYVIFGWTGRAQVAPTPRPQTPPGHASTPSRVTALGRLAPRGEVINVGAPPGDRLVQLTVVEGQRVRAGEIVAYLDSHKERSADRERAARQLAEAQARLDAETAYSSALVTESEARLRQVETSSKLEILVQEARVQQLEAELANSERELRRVTELRSRDLIAQQELDRKELLVRRDQLELQAARVLLAKLRQAHDLDVRVARTQIETAQAGLQRARRAIDIDSLREALRLAEVRVERSSIRAPASGHILKIVARPGEETGTRAILQLGDTSHMYAVAEVYETDVPRVRVSQRATITSPALSRPLAGTVETVGRAISRNLVLDVDPAAATDRRVAEVKIRLDASDVAATLVNLQVTVDIDVGGR